MDELQNIQNLIYVIRGQRVMLDREIKGAHRRTIFLVSRQDFALKPPFVVSFPPCPHKKINVFNLLQMADGSLFGET